MAEVIKLVQGSNELNLKDGSNYETKNVFLETPFDNELWHMPDQGESELVSYEAVDRPCQLDILIKGSSGTDEDGLQNNIVILRRWLEEAKRAERDGSTDIVYLTLQKNLATNAVRHRIKSADVDDSLSHYISERHQGEVQALHVTVSLILAPFGEWTSTITLQNDMFSSPHMVEDSNSDGLADGWAEVDGAETTTTDTTDWLIGGQSQKVVAGADNFGIISDTVTNTADTTAVGYVWVYVASGDVDVHLYDVDAPGVEASTDATSGNADKTLVGTGGNTWLRIVVSSDSIPAGNDLRLDVLAKGGAATFYVDGAYLELGTTTAPDTFMSARNIDNRNDIEGSSQANENRLNYIDVWGIPGDAPALLETRLTWSNMGVGGEDKRLHAGRIIDGIINTGLDRHWIESDEFATGDQPTGAWAAEAGTSDNHYYQFTDGGGGGDGNNRLATFTGLDADYIAFNPKRVYGLLRVSNKQAEIICSAVYGQTGAVTYFTSPIKYIENNNNWELVDFGVMNGQHVLPRNVPDTTNPQVAIKIEFDNVVAAGTCDIDALLLMPARNEFLIIENNSSVNDAEVTYIRGKEQDVILDAEGVAINNVLGSLWEADPGVSNRLVFAVTTTASVFTLTNEAAVQLVITPRTRHLLGT